jgi:hypothetical protein
MSECSRMQSAEGIIRCSVFVLSHFFCFLPILFRLRHLPALFPTPYHYVDVPIWLMFSQYSENTVTFLFLGFLLTSCRFTSWISAFNSYRPETVELRYTPM